MHDLLSEAKNALTHVINHVPAAAYAESGSPVSSSAHRGWKRRTPGPVLSWRRCRPSDRPTDL
jgi:hypothetical protein